MSAAPGRPSLVDLKAAFIDHVRHNRNLSPNTVRAYDTDLSQLVRHLAVRHAHRPSELTIEHFDVTGVRGYLEELHERGVSRASAARHLAALRTFAAYLMRDGHLLAHTTPAQLREDTRCNSLEEAFLSVIRHSTAA